MPLGTFCTWHSELGTCNLTTSTLPTGETAIGIFCSAAGLQLLELQENDVPKVVVSCGWEKVGDIKAKIEEEENGATNGEEEAVQFEILEFYIQGKGCFAFEIEQARDVRCEMSKHAKDHHPQHVHHHGATSSAHYDANEQLEVS
jgi:hypothetical protein